MKKTTKIISEKLDNAQILMAKCLKIVEENNAKKLRLKKEKYNADGFKHFLETMNIHSN